jgi:hypothetical protein
MTLAALSASCGPAQYLSPEDQALRQKVQAEVNLYSNAVIVSARGGRIYLENAFGTCVENYGDPIAIEGAVRQVEGVREVVNDIRNCDYWRDRREGWIF